MRLRTPSGFRKPRGKQIHKQISVFSNHFLINWSSAAAQAVADGGVIKIMPGWTTEKPFFPRKKRIRIEALLGGVTIGVS
jgi:hypothetical protein